ncbi:GNAT family N-acetyltransferase [Sphaerisporangium corydalis]|uniref:GNAT family N-acetyltransferase n=1 Tax=Sphaerisporangium corydalis TaxID=1441875 RepID=A0ABV9ER59_9ACTN|nr:GNAT family N-acetyltransferase [Sphaerisporangium corydalis]
MVFVREMGEADIETVSSVRIASWRAAYAGMVPQAYLDGMSPEEDVRVRRERFARRDGGALDLVAESGGVVVGWLAMGPCRDPDAQAGDGEIYALYVRPDVIGTGAGHALMDAALAAAKERHLRRLLLWVLEDNARARRFYGSAGFGMDGTRSMWEVGGTAVPELRYRLDLS